jgi:hypothetical protein
MFFYFLSSCVVQTLNYCFHLLHLYFTNYGYPPIYIFWDITNIICSIFLLPLMQNLVVKDVINPMEEEDRGKNKFSRCITFVIPFASWFRNACNALIMILHYMYAQHNFWILTSKGQVQLYINLLECFLIWK